MISELGRDHARYAQLLRLKGALPEVKENLNTATQSTENAAPMGE